MAELKRIEEDISTTELLPAKQPENPKLVKGPEPKPPESAAAVAKPLPLFSEAEMGDF